VLMGRSGVRITLTVVRRCQNGTQPGISTAVMSLLKTNGAMVGGRGE